MEKILNQLLSEMKEMRTDMKEMKTDIKGLQTDMTGVKTDIKGLQTDMTGVKTDIKSMKTDIIGLKDGQVRLEGKVDNTNEKVNHLKESLIQGLAPYFDNLEKHIDNNNDKVMAKLQKQQDAIDVLSSRSIQQEGDIKALNRIIRNQ